MPTAGKFIETENGMMFAKNWREDVGEVSVSWYGVLVSQDEKVLEMEGEDVAEGT